MRKTLLILTIICITFVTTACVNKFAVQELNNKAQEMLKTGNVEGAIARLESSIDLDESVFETHYNLAIVYTKSGDYLNAINEYKTVISMKPELADSYYSLATAENNLAIEIKRGNYRINDVDDSLVPTQTEEERTAELTDKETSLMNELYNSAVKNYEKYLELNPKAEDKKDVKETIERIKNYQNPTPEQEAVEEE